MLFRQFSSTPSLPPCPLTPTTPPQRKKTDKKLLFVSWRLGGLLVSALVSGSSGPATVWVRALVGDIVLCSWRRHLTLTVPLSTQE